MTRVGRITNGGKAVFDQKTLFKNAVPLRGRLALVLKGMPHVLDVIVDPAAWLKLNTLDPARVAEFGRAQTFLASHYFRDLGLRACWGTMPLKIIYIMGDPANIKALDRLSNSEPDQAVLNLRRFSNLVGE
ncbi:MAG: hypothetical protein WC529_01940 [Candidatus Margulisiibacteriota bacterium]